MANFKQVEAEQREKQGAQASQQVEAQVCGQVGEDGQGEQSQCQGDQEGLAQGGAGKVDELNVTSLLPFSYR